jgi:hypothetical protein
MPSPFLPELSARVPNTSVPAVFSLFCLDENAKVVPAAQRASFTAGNPRFDSITNSATSEKVGLTQDCTWSDWFVFIFLLCCFVGFFFNAVAALVAARAAIFVAIFDVYMQIN